MVKKSTAKSKDDIDNLDMDDLLNCLDCEHFSKNTVTGYGNKNTKCMLSGKSVKSNDKACEKIKEL